VWPTLSNFFILQTRDDTIAPALPARVFLLLDWKMAASLSWGNIRVVPGNAIGPFRLYTAVAFGDGGGGGSRTPVRRAERSGDYMLVSFASGIHRRP